MKKMIRKKLMTVLLGIFLFSAVSAQQQDSLNLDDVFRMSLTELMNVEVISASKIKQQIKDVAATVQVITAEQIRSRSYFTLEEALSDLPGFQFRNIQGFNSYVFMRGVPSQNNLILLLLDGVQINELNSGGFYAGGQFNLSEVERIEVVYGPASALYGTNAVSGIINIITKSPEGRHKGHVSLLGGSYKTGMVDFSIKDFNAKKRIGFSLSGMYKSTEKADLGGAKGDNNWTERMENFENDLTFSARFQFKNLTAGADFQEKRSSLTTNFLSVGDKYLDKNTLWDIVFFNSYLKYTHQFHEKLSLNSTLYYRNTTVKPNTIYQIEKATDKTTGNQVGYFRPNQLIGFENQLNYKTTERLMFTVGIVGEIEELSEDFSISFSNSQFIKPVAPVKPEMLNNFLFSYYAQANFKISSQLSFIGGLRHDFSNYYGQVLTPRTGLVFNKDKFTAKILYNRAFRAPKPWDYNYGTGNPGLKPEKMHSFEAFGAYSVLDNLAFGVSVYKNVINDKLIKETSAGIDRWINKSELNTFGVEAFGNYSFNAFSVYANYTYSDSYDEVGIYIPEISMHTANAGITHSPGYHVKLNLRANYLGPRKNPMVIQSTGNDIIDDALLFHCCISYLDFNDFDYQLKVNNILNQEYYHPSNRFAGRYRQSQRSFYLTIRYNF